MQGFLLALRNIDSFLHGFYQSVFVIDEIFAVKIGWHRLGGKEYRLFRASFFAEAAENAAQIGRAHV